MIKSVASGEPVKIIPRAAWRRAGVGAILFGAILLAAVVDPNSEAWHRLWIWPVAAGIFFLMMLVLRLRPPGALLYENEMVLRQFLRARRIPRKDVKNVLFEPVQRVIGGDAPGDNKWLSVVIWENGVESVVRLMWCQSLLGLFTFPEAQAAKEAVESWAATGRAATDR